MSDPNAYRVPPTPPNGTTGALVAPPENRLDDSEVAHLETLFGDIARIHCARGRYELVIAAAQPLQWRDFRAAINDDARKAGAQEKLVKATIVGVAWQGQKAIASEDSPAGMAAPRAMLEAMLKTRGFAGVTDGGPMSKSIMRLNSDAQEAEGK